MNREDQHTVKRLVPTAFTGMSLPLLDRIQIASPCDVRWEEMTGDERSRRCARCSLDVHNLAGLTRAEAERLLTRRFNPEGRETAGCFCAQIYRRADGTVLTADCPVGVAALRLKARRAAARLSALLGITSLVAYAAALESRSIPFANAQPLATIAAWLREPTPLVPIKGKVALRGEIRLGRVAPAAPSQPAGPLPARTEGSP
ncbi:MAG TPA: hypothetical protein VEB22_11885 [Phycisphaerales bacterium]|nr:hypothetical protein [Phycisphaerales bacterium]